ncbi:MAG TPA: glycosyltransferase family 87 protein [Dongiaceae bacterium]|nr:glycosyltransferase family 87 protein [Dongiaceae bacterium]
MPNAPKLRFTVTTFCLAMIFVHAALFWAARRQVLSGSPDFRIFYTAGLMLRRGQGWVLYDDALQVSVEREFAPAAVARGGPLPYNHPPFEALVYLPLTYLPYLSAYGIWCVINIVVAVASVYWARSRFPTLFEKLGWIAMLLPFAYFPIAYALMQGQDSILLLALYTLAFLALRRKRDLQAGAWLGLGLFKYHLILPFAFILLLHRRWRALAGMSLVACVELAVSWALVGGRELLYYPHFAWQVNRQQAPGVIVPANMPNLRGLFTGWRGMNPPPHWVEIALAAASVLLLVWASRQWWPLDLSDEQRWDTGFSICVLVAYLVGYHSYNQDMSFLLLPLLLTVDRTLAFWKETSTSLKILLGLTFLSPLYLLLTLQLSHDNLFSIVFLALAGCLAAGSTIQPRASVSSSRGLSGVPLR